MDPFVSLGTGNKRAGFGSAASIGFRFGGGGRSRAVRLGGDDDEAMMAMCAGSAGDSDGDSVGTMFHHAKFKRHFKGPQPLSPSAGWGTCFPVPLVALRHVLLGVRDRRRNEFSHRLKANR